jgi:hypothetical protein
MSSTSVSLSTNPLAESAIACRSDAAIAPISSIEPVNPVFVESKRMQLEFHPFNPLTDTVVATRPGMRYRYRHLVTGCGELVYSTNKTVLPGWLIDAVGTR